MSTALQITIAEYDRLTKKGFFEQLRNRRVELIRGEMRQMSPPGPRHEEAVDALSEWSHEQVDRTSVRVRVQSTVGLPELDSVPLPDVTWVRRRSYLKARPESADLFLVIEVSDSSLNYDRGTKAKLYAAAGIADYWVVNLRDECIEVFRDPQGGEYQSHEVFDRGHTARPLKFPKLKLSVSKLFDWYAT